MPILRPDIQKVLREVGLGESDKDDSVSQRLDHKGLTLDDSLEILSDIAHAGDSSVIKLRAVETSLKLRGVLKEQAAPPPSITIVINDTMGKAPDINPILLPRQLHATLTKEPIN